MGGFFRWDIDREIVSIYGPFGIRWYSLFFILGFLLGNFAMLRIMKREGKDPKLCEPLLYYLVIGTVLGARLGHCLFYDPWQYLSNPLSILKIWEGGLASHGGYLGIAIATYLFGRKYKLSFLWLADRIVIFAILTGAFIRVGNFFNSEIVGRVTDVPWAVVFARVDAYPRHPTQLYEALGYGSIAVIMLLLYYKTSIGQLGGRLLGVGALLGFGFRAIIETFKENQAAFESELVFNMGQLLSVPFIIIGILLLCGVQDSILKKKIKFPPANEVIG